MPMVRSTVPPNWADLPDEELLNLRLSDLPVADSRRRSSRRASRSSASELRTRGLALPDSLLPLGRMVHAGRPGLDGGPVLPGASAARASREGADARGRRRRARVVHAHSASRSRPRHRQRLQAAAAPRSAAACSAARRSPIRSSTTRGRTARASCMHLDPWYAQSHPDEDFAETFAVWLTPESNWKPRYAGWPAIKKLDYMDALMKSLVGKKPLARAHRRGRSAAPAAPHAAPALPTQAPAPRGRPPELLRSRPAPLFSDAPEFAGNMTAAQFLGRIAAPSPPDGRRLDRHLPVHHRQGARRHDRPLPRAQAAAGRARRAGAQEFTVLLTVQTMNYLHSGRHRVAL